MSVEAHRQAELLMARADERLAAGDPSVAALLYSQAAAFEEQALALIPPSRMRTRGIVAVSTASLFAQAGKQREAARIAYGVLLETELPDAFRAQLLDIALDAERQRQAPADGGELGVDALRVSLRGNSVRAGGLAPLDTVVLKLQQLKNCLVRVGEWASSTPIRTSGEPSPEVSRACVPLISPPATGSYQFELRLSSAVPLNMLDSPERALTPERITTAFFRILQDVTTDNPLFEQRVASPEYRDLFMKLVRGLVPDGQGLDEIEISHKTAGASAYLRPQMRAEIQQRLLATHPPTEMENTRYGVLRALHLDKGWLVLVEDGQPKYCRIQQGKVFHDVVGPLVNRRVGVSGQWRGKSHRSFDVDDIFEALEPTSTAHSLA